MTAQVPDWIRIELGDWVPLHSTPNIFGPSALKRFSFLATTTACYRGYTARWQIRAGELLLTSIGGTVRIPNQPPARPGNQVSMIDIYGSYEPILAHWVTETLLIPEPDRPWEYMGGIYLKVDIAAGKIVKEHSIISILP